ncbi:MAG: hypothetical protein K9J13_07990 [Saprospiraceae bacterium]|nr:hypothetical protein [Saprospiraceae bacterium]
MKKLNLVIISVCIFVNVSWGQNISLNDITKNYNVDTIISKDYFEEFALNNLRIVNNKIFWLSFEGSLCWYDLISNDNKRFDYNAWSLPGLIIDSNRFFLFGLNKNLIFGNIQNETINKYKIESEVDPFKMDYFNNIVALLLNQKTIEVYYINNNKINLVKKLKSENSVWSLKLSEVNKKLYLGYENGIIEIRNIENFKVEKSLKSSMNEVFLLDISFDGKFIAASDQKNIAIFSSQGELINTYNFKDGFISRLKFHPEKNYLFVACERDIKIIDIAVNKVLLEKDIVELSKPTESPLLYYTDKNNEKIQIQEGIISMDIDELGKKMIILTDYNNFKIFEIIER